MDHLAGAATAEGLQPLDVVAALDSEAFLVDVRDRDQRARGGHIPDDMHVPARELEAVRCNDPRSRRQGFTRERRIILYCETGERAAEAAHGLASQGFMRVAYLLGGLAAWRTSGLEGGLPPRVDLDQSREDRS